jgi:EmrB/QacA subfamily drug resistance transporter
MTANQKLVLLASILGSFVAFLDGSVVNVALPAMQAELGGGIATQQWIVDAYLLTLGSLILLAGSLSDLFGRKRVFAAGLIGFAVTSLACAFAPTAPVLIIARGLQGMAGALLVPSSLALIVGNFSGAGQAKAIGSWTAWTGMSFIAGPLLGGALVDAASWRWIFAINVVPVAATLVILARVAREPTRGGGASVDWLGALTCVLGLGGVIFALIEQPRRGWHAPAIYLPLAGGTLACVAFVVWERRVRHPMLDFALFRNRNFAAGNAATVAIYAGLGGSTFLIAVFLQQVAGYSATAAGLALMPLTLLMFVLSPVAGRLAGRWGARWFMTAGPVLAAAGLALMATLDADIGYARDLLPGVLLLGLGLSTTVAPLTAAVLGGVDERHAGVGSAINNAVARVAGLLAVAAIGAIVATEAHTLAADAKQASVRAFGVAMVSMAALLAIGGAVSAIGIRRRPSQDPAAARPASPPSRAGG